MTLLCTCSNDFFYLQYVSKFMYSIIIIYLFFVFFFVSDSGLCKKDPAIKVKYETSSGFLFSLLHDEDTSL